MNAEKTTVTSKICFEYTLQMWYYLCLIQGVLFSHVSFDFGTEIEN